VHRNIAALRSIGISVFCLLLAYSNTAGAQLAEEKLAIDIVIQEVWSHFLEKLRENDAIGAASFIRPRIRKQHLEAFESWGKQLYELPAGWSEIKAVSLAEPFSEYTIFRGTETDERMHLITFVKTDGESWMIYTL